MTDPTPIPNLTPGTHAYAGVRMDERTKLLDATIKRTRKTRGEASDLASNAKLIHATIYNYDKSDNAKLPIVEELESIFGSIIARLNEIGDERETSK